MRFLIGLTVIVMSLAPPVRAELSLPAVFSDHMVLQRQQPIAVWGKADPGQKVQAALGDAQATATAGDDGRWTLQLPEFDAGGPHVMTVTAGEQALRFEDVLIGDVWLVSGQSNAMFGLKDTLAGAKAAVEAAKLADRLRINRRRDWQQVDQQGALGFSAVCIYFALELAEHVDVPIGLIQRGQGGVMIQSFISPRGLKADPVLRENTVEPWQRYRAQYEQRQARLEAMPAEQRPIKAWPDPDEHTSAPSVLFHRDIEPVIPYTLRGVLWYQGESDAWGFPIAGLYKHHLRALVDDWRAHWNDKDLPFVLFQLPNYKPAAMADPVATAPWPIVQEAQAQLAAEDENVALAVGIDTEAPDIHPRRKRFFGERAARAALEAFYDADVAGQGPTLKDMRIVGDKVHLQFDHARGLHAEDGQLAGFAIAGADRAFHWARGKIEGDTVILHSPEVDQPVAVRYAFWEASPYSLYNKAGLPAGPFRTDDWPWDTPAKRERTLTARRVADAPVIDGRLSDAAWRQAEAAGGFQRIHTYADAPHPTRAMVAWDQQHLYVAFEARCGEKQPRAEAEKRDANAIFQDDNVEVLIDADRDGQSYYRIAVNPAGALWDARGVNRRGIEQDVLMQEALYAWRSIDPKWDGTFERATARGAGRWTVELAIPWKTIGRDGPPAGQALPMQFNRYLARANRHVEWATTGRDRNTGAMMPPHAMGQYIMHHSPRRFGTVEFAR